MYLLVIFYTPLQDKSVMLLSCLAAETGVFVIRCPILHGCPILEYYRPYQAYQFTVAAGSLNYGGPHSLSYVYHQIYILRYSRTRFGCVMWFCKSSILEQGRQQVYVGRIDSNPAKPD